MQELSPPRTLGEALGLKTGAPVVAETTKVAPLTQKPPATLGEALGVRPPKGIGEAFSEIGAEQLPFAGQVVSAVKAKQMLDLADRLESGEATQEDADQLGEILKEGGRETTLGYDVVSILRDMPAYVAEFAAGGSVSARLASKGGAKVVGAALRKAIREGAERVGAQAAARTLRKAPGVLGKTIVQTAMMPGRAVANAAQRTVEDRLGLTEDRKYVVFQGSLPSLAENLPEGFLDTYIENVSEHSGGLVPAEIGLRRLATKLLGDYLAVVPGASVDKAIEKLSKATGWNGLIPEMGEERFGAALRAALLGDPWADVIPSGRQLAAEGIAFAVPGAVASAARGLAGAAPDASRGAPAGVPPGSQGAAPGATVAPPDGVIRPGEPTPPGQAEPESPPEQAAKPDKLPPSWVEFEQQADAADEVDRGPSEPAKGTSLMGENLAAVVLVSNAQIGHLSKKELKASQIVEPRTPIELWGRELLGARGAELVVVDAGKPLALSGGYTEGVVVTDRRAPSQRRLRAVLFHELAHHLRKVRNQAWTETLADIAAVDPEGLREAMEEYGQEFYDATRKQLPVEQVSNEGMSRYVEGLVGYLDLALRDKKRAVRMATKNPGFFESIVDAVIRLVNQVLRTKIPTNIEKQLRAFQAEALAMLGPTTDYRASQKRARARDPQLSAQLALKIVSLFDEALGAKVSEGMPKPSAEEAAPEAQAGPAAPPEPAEQTRPAARRGRKPAAGQSPAPAPTPAPAPPAPPAETPKPKPAPTPKPAEAAPAPAPAPEKPKKESVEEIVARKIRERQEAAAKAEAEKPEPKTKKERIAERTGVEAAPPAPPAEEPKVTWKKARLIPTRTGIKTELVEEPASAGETEQRQWKVDDKVRLISRPDRTGRVVSIPLHQQKLGTQVGVAWEGKKEIEKVSAGGLEDANVTELADAPPRALQPTPAVQDADKGTIYEDLSARHDRGKIFNRYLERLQPREALYAKHYQALLDGVMESMKSYEGFGISLGVSRIIDAEVRAITGLEDGALLLHVNQAGGYAKAEDFMPNEFVRPNLRTSTDVFRVIVRPSDRPFVKGVVYVKQETGARAGELAAFETGMVLPAWAPGEEAILPLSPRTAAMLQDVALAMRVASQDAKEKDPTFAQRYALYLMGKSERPEFSGGATDKESQKQQVAILESLVGTRPGSAQTEPPVDLSQIKVVTSRNIDDARAYVLRQKDPQRRAQADRVLNWVVAGSKGERPDVPFEIIQSVEEFFRVAFVAVPDASSRAVHVYRFNSTVQARKFVKQVAPEGPITKQGEYGVRWGPLPLGVSGSKSEDELLKETVERHYPDHAYVVHQAEESTQAARGLRVKKAAARGARLHALSTLVEGEDGKQTATIRIFSSKFAAEHEGGKMRMNPPNGLKKIGYAHATMEELRDGAAKQWPGAEIVFVDHAPAQAHGAVPEKKAPENPPKDLVDLTDELNEMFSVEWGALFSVESYATEQPFDAAKYERAKPIFERAVGMLGTKAKDPEALVEALIDGLLENGLKPEKLQSMHPYLVRFASDALRLKTSLHEAIAAEFNAGRAIRGIRELRKLAADNDLDGYTDKELEEQAELAVVIVARQRIASGRAANEADATIYRALMELYALMPTLQERTSEQRLFQAYSTPLPMAFVASRLARVTDQDTVYEPTAGNGALLIEANPERTHANEIQPGRAENLRVQGFQVTMLDAVGDGTSTPPNLDVVLTNPPFGKNEQGLQLDWEIPKRALSGLKPNGRAVLIIGSPAADQHGRLPKLDSGRAERYREGPVLRWMSGLYEKFRVVEHFIVDGDLYKKQGAAWPVDVIVIDGHGESVLPRPALIPPKVIESYADLEARLPKARSVRPAGDQPSGGVGVREPERIADAPAVRGPAQGEGGDARGESGRAELSDPRGPVASPEPGRLDGDRGGEAVDGDVAGVPASGGSQQGANVAGAGPVASNLPARAAEPGEPAPEGERARVVEHGEYQVAYTPTAEQATSVGSLMPKNMHDAYLRASNDLRSRLPEGYGFDRYVAEKLGMTIQHATSVFSAEQIDALALAFDNIDRGSSFIIGDQTGVGKGRFVAGVLLYAKRVGAVPVFLTEKPDLYGDIHRDLYDIGVTDLRVMVTNSGLRGSKALLLPPNPQTGHSGTLQSLTPTIQSRAYETILSTGKMPEGFDALFTTYDQMRPIGGTMVQRHHALQAIAPNAIFVLDESHNAVGMEPPKTRGGKEDPKHLSRAKIIRRALMSARGAVFSSATWAKNPYALTLYWRTDLSKAFAGQNIESSMASLREALDAGGHALQQIASNSLAAAGQYLRRERSYQGVPFREHTIGVRHDQAEVVAEMISKLIEMDMKLDAARDELSTSFLAEGGKFLHLASQGFRAADAVPFVQVMHNISGQALLALKADEAAALAVKAFKESGQKPVLTVSSTLETVLDEWMVSEGREVGDSAAGLHMGHLLARYLRNMLRLTFKDKNDDFQHYYITEEDLQEIGQGELIGEIRALKAEILETDPGLTISPIDRMRRILEDAGLRVGELTGRHLQIDDRTMEIKARKPSSALKQSTIRRFQNGELDALILNRSASTGISLHAVKGADGGTPQPRHMFIVQPEDSIETFAQILGRIHRTGQVKLPFFTNVVANVPSERRIAARVRKKLSSLNASVTSNTQSDVQIGDIDFLNKYGDQIAADYLDQDTVLRLQMRLLGYRDADTGEVTPGLARKLTGRMASLPLKKQEEIANFLLTNYKALIETLDRLGQNDLEAKTLDVDARFIPGTEQIVTPGIPNDPSPFAEPSRVVIADLRRLSPAVTFAEAQDRAKEGEPGSVFLDEVTEAEVEALQKATANLDEKDKELQEAQEQFEQAEKRRQELDPEATDPKESSKLSVLVSTLRDRVGRATMARDAARVQPDTVRAQASNIRRWLQTLTPGKTTYLGSEAGMFPAVVLGVVRSKGVKSSLASSAFQVHVMTTEGNSKVSIPFSQLGRKFNVIDASSEVIRSAFDEASKSPREVRPVLLGNVLAGFAAIGRKGQVNFVRDNQGRVHPAVLLPKDFKVPEIKDQAQPQKAVTWDAPTVVDAFFDAPNDSEVAQTSDGLVTLGKTPGGIAYIRASGRKIHTDRVLIDLVGGFRGRGSGSLMATFEPMGQAPRGGLALVEAILRIEREHKKAWGPFTGQKTNFAVEAWHGSGAKGIQRFDPDFIRSGEGALAFGWGFYFTEVQGIGNHYRQKIGKNMSPPLSVLRDYFKPGNVVMGYAGLDRVVSFNEKADGLWSVTVERVTPEYGDARGEIVYRKTEPPRTHQTTPEWKEIEAKTGHKPGALYRVKLNVEKHQLLDYVAPTYDDLPMQAVEAAKRIVAPYANTYFGELLLKQIQLNNPRYETHYHPGAGAALYWNLAELKQELWQSDTTDSVFPGESEEDVRHVLAPRWAAQQLLQHGIRGIRYPADFHGGGKQGAENIVIFDPADIDVEAEFAVEPKITKEIREQVRAAAAQALKEAEETRIGSRPNPIADTSGDPEIRAFNRGVREARAGTPDAETHTWADARQQATEALAADYDGVRSSLLRRVSRGELLSDWEQVALDIVSQADAFAALRGDAAAYARGVQARWIYQNAGRDVARSLAIRRGRPPSARERMADLLTTPGRETRAKLDDLQKERADPETTDTRREEIDAKIYQLLVEEGKRLERAADALRELGFPPELVTDAWFSDLAAVARISRAVSHVKSGRFDWLIELRLSAMLGGPLTQVANITGNAFNIALQQGVMRIAEAMVNTFVQDPKSASWGEVYHYFRSVLPSIIRSAGVLLRAYRYELPVFEMELRDKGVPVKLAGSKVDVLNGPVIGDIPILGVNIPVGRIIRAPSLTSLLAFDEFFKSISATTEAHALAYRYARAEGLEGDALVSRTNEILEDYGHPIHVRSLLKARTNLFQEEHGTITRFGLQARKAIDRFFGGLPVGSFLLPFVVTPVGIFKAGLSAVFYPAMAIRNVSQGQWKGRPDRMTADLARSFVAFAITALVISLVNGGDDDDLPLITGSVSPKAGERDLSYRTVPSYSIRVPFTKRWISYRRVEPAAVSIATIVDLANEANRYARQGAQASFAASMGRILTSVGNQLSDKTFLQTLGDIYEILVSQDSGKAAGPRLLADTFVVSMIPNVARQPIRQLDPYIRASEARQYEDRGVWSAVAVATWHRLWPFGDNVPPPRYSIWGKPAVKPDAQDLALARILSPTPTSQLEANIEPVDLMIWRYNRAVEAGKHPDAEPFLPKPPDYWFDEDGKTHYWSNEEYERFQRDAGERAFARVQRMRLDYENPSPKDIERVKDALADARRTVSRRLKAERRRATTHN